MTQDDNPYASPLTRGAGVPFPWMWLMAWFATGIGCMFTAFIGSRIVEFMVAGDWRFIGGVPIGLLYAGATVALYRHAARLFAEYWALRKEQVQ